MTETDQEKMDQVLKRMLATPPQPHKPKDNERPKPKEGRDKQ